MNRCKNCKHWGDTGKTSMPDPHNPGARLEYQNESTISARRDVKDCVRINESGLLEMVGEPFGDQGTIVPGPEFGCVLWEPHVENR